MLQFPPFQNPCIQPFPDETEQHSISHPSLDKLLEPTMFQSVEELSDVHLEDPSTPRPRQRFPEALQCLMRTFPWAEAERAGQKVLFVDRLQHHGHRPLQYLVFKGRNAQRTGRLPVPFGNMHTPDGRCPVEAGLRADEERLEVGFQFLRVLPRRLSVHSDCTVLARAPIRLA